ncbi:isochorismatase family protein [Maritimibacter sp. DP1N21-5]|uniref:isochorismatase family protein n=1 Tax=Maritimibacter sp. DP1N21-5 TaxID=2836867 RepID=UPI001C438159|nr:isochorismatase family protein [Maritimibacter sp. DP1N21-5]MBV7408072.1 isochorismatase family protein [Maritimibacter sp. DP1N21-5]
MTKALLVIDMQVSLIEDETPEPERIMSAVYGLVDRARAAGVPVVWVTDRGVSPDPSMHAAFRVKPGEAQIWKTENSAFEGTTLAGELGGRGVDEVVVCGMQSDFCVTATVLAAPKYGFPVTLVSDAHMTHGFDGRDWQGVVDFVNADVATRKDVRVMSASEVAF